jgi:hypothetical protein
MKDSPLLWKSNGSFRLQLTDRVGVLSKGVARRRSARLVDAQGAAQVCRGDPLDEGQELFS